MVAGSNPDLGPFPFFTFFLSSPDLLRCGLRYNAATRTKATLKIFLQIDQYRSRDETIEWSQFENLPFQRSESFSLTQNAALQESRWKTL